MRIALVQFRNDLRDPSDRRRELEELVVAAAVRGADFVVTPELSISGYIPNRTAWKRAERRDGASVAWACEIARKRRVHIGFGLLEKLNEDYYNAYFIVDPNGRLCGWYRKHKVETYAYAPADDAPWMDTPLGRVGIGICADNHFGAHLRRLQAAAVDVVIMPHASPSPAGTSRIVDQRDLARSERIPVDLVTVYATMLGVPVALVNAIGILPPMEGMLGRMMKNGKFILAGRSCLVNADGVVVGKMQAEEGFMILDTGRKGKPAEAEIKTYDGDWLHPGNPFLRRMILPIDEKRGARAYAKWTRGT